VTNDVFTVPLERERFLVYAPERRVAFVGNPAMVDGLARLLEGDIAPDDGVRDVAVTCALLESPPSHSVDAITRLSLPLSTFEAGRRAIDAALSGLQQGLRLHVSYEGPANLLLGVGRQLYDYTVHQTGRRQLELVSEWVGPGPLSPMQSQWIIDHLAAAILTVIENAADLTRWPDVLWSPTLRLLDATRFPYKVRLELQLEDVQELEGIVRRLCSAHRPRGIEILTRFDDRSEPSEPTHHVRSLFTAFKAARRIARNSDCAITVPGADLTERQNFLGYRPGELVAAIDGSVMPQPDQDFAYCEGCFARGHCAGPASAQMPMSPDDWAGSERCHLVREVVKGTVIQQIADSGGLLWAEPTPPGKR
jgi:hypothetical protein